VTDVSATALKQRREKGSPFLGHLLEGKKCNTINPLPPSSQALTPHYTQSLSFFLEEIRRGGGGEFFSHLFK
jgi:hypothetical protein